MTVLERNALAADIARRVRTFTWQPLPAELVDALGPHAWQYRQLMYGPSGYPPALEATWHPAYRRLELAFVLASGERVGRLLWTPDMETDS